jgi:hypothetical protein
MFGFHGGLIVSSMISYARFEAAIKIETMRAKKFDRLRFDHEIVKTQSQDVKGFVVDSNSAVDSRAYLKA